MAKEPVMAGEWLDTQSVMRVLGISERRVQQRAAEGYLKFKTVQNGLHRKRLYEAESVEQFRQNGPETKPPADITSKELAAELVAQRELPPSPPRRNFTFSLPEGKIMAGFPAELSDGSVAEARSFLELVLRQLPAGASATSETAPEAFAG